jgi:hypothetical protein
MAEEKDTSPNLGKAFLASLPAALAGGVIGYADAVNKTNTLPQYLQQLAAQDERRRKKEEADTERQEGLDRAIQRANSNPLTKAAFDEMGGAEAFAGASGGELDAALGNRLNTQEKVRTEEEANLLAEAQVQRLLEDDTVGGRMSTLMRENPELPVKALAALGLQMEQQHYEKEDREFRAQERQQKANDRRTQGVLNATTADELNIAVNGLTPEEASDPAFRAAYMAQNRTIKQDTLRKALAGGVEELSGVPGLIKQVEGSSAIVNQAIAPYQPNYTAIINAVTDDPEITALQKKIGEKTLEDVLLEDPALYADIQRLSPDAVASKLGRETLQKEERTVGELHTAYVTRLGNSFGGSPEAFGAGKFARTKPKEVMNTDGTLTPRGRNLFIEDLATDFARRGVNPYTDTRRLNALLGAGTATEIYEMMSERTPGPTPSPAEAAALDDRADVSQDLDLVSAVTNNLAPEQFGKDRIRPFWAPADSGEHLREYSQGGPEVPLVGLEGLPGWGSQGPIASMPWGSELSFFADPPAQRRRAVEDAEKLWRNLPELKREVARQNQWGFWHDMGSVVGLAERRTAFPQQVVRAEFYGALVKNDEVESFIRTGAYSRNVARNIQQDDSRRVSDAVIGQLGAAMSQPPIEEDAVVAQASRVERLKGELEALGETAPQAIVDQKTNDVTRAGLQLQKLEARQKAQTETRPILRQLIDEDWLSESAEDLAEKLQGKFVKQGFNPDNFQKVITTDLGTDYTELDYGEKLLRIATIWRTRKDQFSQGADPQAANRSAQAEATADEFERLANIYIKATQDLEEMGLDRVNSLFPRSLWAWDGKDMSQLVHQFVKEARSRVN